MIVPLCITLVSLRISRKEFTVKVQERKDRPSELKEIKMNVQTEVVATIATAILAIGTLNAPAQAQAVAPTDPQIVGIVVAANQIDIDYAKLALSKSKNKQIHAFARQMVRDHSALQKSYSILARN
jgi:anti-sigma-K factor RskA